MIEYKGYTGVFEYDPEIEMLAGHVIDLRDEIYFEGDSVEALEASMRRAVDEYLYVCRERGEEPERPFSGKLHLRLGSDLHRAAARAAAAEGESLNSWLVRVVEAATRETASEPANRTVPESRPSIGPRHRNRRTSGG